MRRLSSLVQVVDVLWRSDRDRFLRECELAAFRQLAYLFSPARHAVESKIASR